MECHGLSDGVSPELFPAASGVGQALGAILGAVVLLSEDGRWADRAGEPAYYVHNLVTEAAAPGLGGWMLGELETLARKDGKAALRLDCAVDNAALNDYYASHGYREAGRCADGAYRGIRREKRL